MDWKIWVFISASFLIGLVIGLLADGYKYETGRKCGMQDKEEEIMPIIARLQKEIIQEKKKRKKMINGIYQVKEEDS